MNPNNNENKFIGMEGTYALNQLDTPQEPNPFAQQPMAQPVQPVPQPMPQAPVMPQPAPTMDPMMQQPMAQPIQQPVVQPQVMPQAQPMPQAPVMPQPAPTMDPMMQQPMAQPQVMPQAPMGMPQPIPTMDPMMNQPVQPVPVDPYQQQMMMDNQAPVPQQQSLMDQLLQPNSMGQAPMMPQPMMNNNANFDAPKAKKGGGLKIVIILVVVLAVVGAALYFFVFRDSGKKLTCTATEDAEGVKASTKTTFKFDDKNVVKGADSEIKVTATTDEAKAQLQAVKTIYDAVCDEMNKNVKGTCSTSMKDDALTIKINLDYSKKDDYGTELTIDYLGKTYDELKQAAEADGYTCK